MKIYKFVNRVPGGLMVVPLFVGMAINTFFPDLLKIGGFTQALTGVGYPTILGMYLFTVGTKMTVRAAPKMLWRGFGILAAKVLRLLQSAVRHLMGRFCLFESAGRLREFFLSRFGDEPGERRFCAIEVDPSLSFVELDDDVALVDARPFADREGINESWGACAQ